MTFVVSEKEGPTERTTVIAALLVRSGGAPRSLSHDFTCEGNNGGACAAKIGEGGRDKANKKRARWQSNINKYNM